MLGSVILQNTHHCKQRCMPRTATDVLKPGRAILLLCVELFILWDLQNNLQLAY